MYFFSLSWKFKYSVYLVLIPSNLLQIFEKHLNSIGVPFLNRGDATHTRANKFFPLHFL